MNATTGIPKMTMRIQYQTSKESPIVDLGEQELTPEITNQIASQEG
jgi:hypothetical protein